MASLLEKTALFGGLLRGERAGRGPVYVNLDLVARCNNVCLGCFFHCEETKLPRGEGALDVEELPLELAGKVASELASVGVREVYMAGEGEPFLHSRFFDVIALLKQAGLWVQVFTSGILLDETVARRIADSGIDNLTVSLWAVTEAEHERWHPGISPKMLSKRLQGIRALAHAREKSSSRIELALQMPINRENLGALEGRVEIAVESGATSVSFGYYRAYGSSLDYLALGPGDMPAVRAAFRPALTRLDAAGIRHDADVFLERVGLGLSWLNTPCYAPWYACSIRINGDVLACPRCRVPMGNLGSSSFSSIWKGAPYRAFRRKAMRHAPATGFWDSCECSNCCWTRDNLRVHRYFRWLAPIVRRRAGKDPSE